MFRSLGSAVLLLLTASFTLAQTRIISHVTTADGGFSTSVLIENTAVTSRTVTLNPYANDGTPLEAVRLTLDARANMREDAHTLLGEATSHFTIEGSDEVRVSAFYDFRSGNNASPAFVGSDDEQGSSWRLLTGNWNQVFDGLAVVNTGDVATDVWVAQKDDQNNVLDAVLIAEDLAPNAKTLFVIGAPGNTPFAATDGTFEVSGDQLLAVTALQGTLENDTINILLAAEAEQMSQATSKRDDRGVWFIEDGDLYDVFEMMGYNVATDRMWQMDIFRREATGRLAELAPVDQFPTLYETDAIARRRGYSDAQLDAYWADLDAESQIMIQSYVDGVNRRIAQVNAVPDLLQVEYKALGEDSIEPWTYRDLMAHAAAFQLGFSMRAVGTEQVLNGALLQDLVAKYGEEQGAIMFNDLRYLSDPQSQTMIEPVMAKRAATKQEQELPRLRDDLPDVRQGFYDYVNQIAYTNEFLEQNGILIKGGSYAWAVSGDLTESGNPILYSGPQVGFGAPNLFVEGSIESDAVRVSGMAIPGLPSVIVGRTPHHAWSMQVGYAGTWDYYLESDEDTWVDRQETIHIKGADPVTIDVEVSAHGPILQDMDGMGLAFKYAHRDYAFDLAPGLLNLARATDMDSFGAAVESLAVSQHICYVDTDGNIAYWHAGRQPVRPAGDYRVPQGMLADQDVLEWDASVVEPLYHERNPAKGYFAGWNNKPHPDFIDYSATTALGPYHRGHMIRDWFESLDPAEKVSYEDLEELAVYIGASGNWAAGGNPWTQLGDAVRAAVDANPTDAREAAMALFDTWDGLAVAGGSSQWVRGEDIADASVLLDAMIPRLVAKTFTDEIGEPPVTQDMLTRLQVFLLGVYEDGLNNDYDWFTNLEDATAPQTADAIILATLDELLAELGEAPWGTQARGLITYPHLLFGPITALGVTTPTLAAKRGSYAQCVEYGIEGPVRIESIFALGQDGTITGTLFFPTFSPNTLSMKEDFDNFVLRPFPLFGE